MQYKIPQNIGIEDKIVGPFSLKQLIIVAVGGGISYVLFAIASKLYELSTLEYIVIAIPGLLALAIALIKINNLSFTQYLLLALEFAIKPKRRIWNHRGISALVNPDLNGIQKADDSKKVTEKTRKNVNLNDLTRILDSGGFEGVQTIQHEDIDETQDDNLMVEAFFGNKKGKGENMWVRTAKDKEGYKRKLDLLSKLPKPELQALKEVKEQISLLKRQQEEIAGLDSPKALEGSDKKRKIAFEQTVKSNAEKPRIPDTCPKCGERMKSGHICADKKKELEPIKKKKRRRKKKPKTAQPVRQETQINNTNSKKPVQLLPKTQTTQPTTREAVPPKPANQPENNTTPKNIQQEQEAPFSGEIHLEELQKGDIDLTL
ncbi:PrgI family protein [Candidatus Peregrinibacteria bacterium]|nr:PrgI family protein [Candidatus Peregrinibacteria bacterium]